MVINWLDFMWYELILKGIFKQTLPRGYLLVKLSLARLFNSRWHNYLTVPGTILHKSLTQFFNSHWCNSSIVAGTIFQESLAQLFNSHWHHDCSTVTDMVVQQSLARLFNSYWHNSSTVTGKIFFSVLAEFFKSDVHCRRIVPCTRNATNDPRDCVALGKNMFHVIYGEQKL